MTDSMIRVPKENDPINVTLEYLKYADQMPRWDNEALQGLLRSTPYLIQIHSNRLIELQTKLEEEKNTEKQVYAYLKLESIKLKERKELSSESDRSSWVECQETMKEARSNVIKAKRDVMIQQALVDRLNNTFIAIRKATSLLTEAEHSIDIGQKYT